MRDDLALMDGYHSPQVDVAVRLNTNEAPEPPPAAWLDALADDLHSVEWHRYPDRAATELRRAIAAHHGVPYDWIFAANGSNEVLQSLLLAFGGPDRRAAVFEPTYALHGHIARVTGTEVVVGERGPDFTLADHEVRSVVESARPDVCFLCSPNNPTGMIDTPELVSMTTELVERHGGLTVIDEAYGQFAPTSALELVDGDRPLVVTRTFSKTWSMAALRLGYLVGPPWLVTALERVVLPYHLDVVKQRAGALALDYEAEMNRRVAELVTGRDRLNAGLARLPVEIWPSAANFILFRPNTAPGAEVWQALVDRSVLVRNCASWDRLDGCLRVTVGTPDENSAFLEALGEILEGS